MQHRSVRTMVQCAFFAALMAVCAQLMLPVPPIPVNLALMAVHLCTAMLGTRKALIAVAVYLLMGLFGLPVFAALSGGPGVLLGPSGGYLAGYMLCVLITGRLLSCRCTAVFFPAMAAGTLGCYAAGVCWYMHLTGTALLPALSVCVLPFLPGDVLKILLAALLARRLRHVIRS